MVRISIRCAFVFAITGSTADAIATKPLTEFVQSVTEHVEEFTHTNERAEIGDPDSYSIAEAFTKAAASNVNILNDRLYEYVMTEWQYYTS